MPTYGIWVVEWPNQNSQRAYPLSELATRQDVTGAFRLPDDFLLSLTLPVNAALSVTSDKFYLQTIVIFPSGYNLTFGYYNGADNPKVASVVVPRALHTENLAYPAVGLGDFADTLGQAQIGRLDSIDEQPAGQFTFDFAGGRLDAFCIQPTLRGVSSIQLRNGSALSDRLYGEIELVAGTNMEISIEVDDESGYSQIRFDALDGSDLTERCDCVGDDTKAPPIRTINGVPPTVDGDFSLVPGECIQISALTNGLSLLDTCSAPCCGCKELEAITSQLESFGDNVRTLENFGNRLQVEVTQMGQVVLGSRLNDSGCVNPS